jgi:hypothetical protein
MRPAEPGYVNRDAPGYVNKSFIRKRLPPTRVHVTLIEKPGSL